MKFNWLTVNPQVPGSSPGRGATNQIVRLQKCGLFAFLVGRIFDVSKMVGGNGKGFHTLILSSLFLFSIGAKANSMLAVDIDASIGQSKWIKSMNGQWWQDPFSNKFNLESQSWSLGVSDKINTWSRWKVGYTDLGQVSSYAEAVADDANYNGSGCNNPCLPMSHWNGWGQVSGIYFIFSPEYKIGDWSIFADIGIWNYKPEFTMTIPDWKPDFINPPRYVRVVADSSRIWGNVIGIGVSYKNLIMTLRQYDVETADREFPAIYQKYTTELSIGFRW